MADLFRTPEGAQKYRNHRAQKAPDAPCALCDAEAIETFVYWKIIPNRFPYDRIATIHEMVVPVRHATKHALIQEEWGEFSKIKGSRLQEYDYFIEAANKTKSIPQYFHLHLNCGKGTLVTLNCI